MQIHLTDFCRYPWSILTGGFPQREVKREIPLLKGQKKKKKNQCLKKVKFISKSEFRGGDLHITKLPLAMCL